MSNEKKIREARLLFDSRLKQATQGALYGTVQSTDEKMRTCEVQVGGIVYEEVLLYAVIDDSLPGRVLIPKVGSTVLVSRIDASNRFYVAMFSQIEKVIFTIGDKVTMVCDEQQLDIAAPKIVLKGDGGGDYGGLILIEPLIKKINEMVNIFNNHQHSINSSGIAVTGSLGSATNPKPVIVPAPTDQQDTLTRQDYEDDKVTH